MHWIYLIHEFHNLSWITEINELFHDILIYWDAPVYKQHNCFNIDNNNNIKCWAANQHIRMISEGSRDTKGWSNDAEIQLCITGINYILQYIQIENCYFKS